MDVDMVKRFEAFVPLPRKALPYANGTGNQQSLPLSETRDSMDKEILP